MRILAWLLPLALALLTTEAQGFITDIGPLLQLVSGQITEIQKLTEQVGLAKDQQNTLIKLNEGINQTVSQIRSVETLISRAQGLDPRSVRSLSDLNDLLYRANQVRLEINELLRLKIRFS